jgi:hypothetical protein
LDRGSPVSVKWKEPAVFSQLETFEQQADPPQPCKTTAVKSTKDQMERRKNINISFVEN